MNAAKNPDPNGIFRCRYCKKCIKGLDAFVVHKREHHSNEIQHQKQERRTRGQVSELEDRCRPGPKSKKGQLIAVAEDKRVLYRPNSSKSSPKSASSGAKFHEEDSLNTQSTTSNDSRKGDVALLAQNEACTEGRVESLLPDQARNPKLIEKGEDEIKVLFVYTPLKQRKSHKSSVRKEKQVKKLFAGNAAVHDDEDVQIVAVSPKVHKNLQHGVAPASMTAHGTSALQDEILENIQNPEVTSTNETTTKGLEESPSPSVSPFAISPKIFTAACLISKLSLGIPPLDSLKDQDEEHAEFPIVTCTGIKTEPSADELENMPKITSVYSCAVIETPSTALTSAPSTLTPESVNLTTMETRYKCEFCDKSFRRISDKTQHSKIFHPSPLPYKCSTCSESFVQERSLIRHESLHTQYPCRICHQKFKAKADFDTHVKIHQETVHTPITGKTDTIPNHQQTDTSQQQEETVEPSMPKSKPKDSTSTYPAKGTTADGKRISKNREYQCEYCVKSFLYPSHLNYHLNTHTGVRPFKCRFCPEAFAAPTNLRKHHCTQHKLPSGKSEMKNNPATTSNAITSVPMKTGKAPTSSMVKEVSCKAGRATTSNIRKEKKSKIFKPAALSINEVVKTMTTNVSPQVSTGSSLKLSSVTKNKNQAATKRSLQPRVRKYHYSDCPVCKKTFRKDYISEHMRIHTGELISCDYCEMRFNTRLNLSRHKRKMHTQEISYDCVTCGEHCESVIKLSQHRCQHPSDLKEKAHACSVCAKTFISKKYLQSHLRVHSRPFPCSHCDKSFDLEVCMEDHIRMSHTKERPFHCMKCKRKFSSEVIYLRHCGQMSCKPLPNARAAPVNHTEESIEFHYKCTVCNTNFTRQALAEAHKEWHRTHLLTGT